MTFTAANLIRLTCGGTPTPTPTPTFYVSGTPADAIYDVGYDSELTITGGTPWDTDATGFPPYQVSITDGALPEGVSASVTFDNKALLNGVPSDTAGTYSFTLTVEDSLGTTADYPTSITIPAFPSALTIEFGELTRAGFGGHYCGNADGGTLSITAGNGAGHWAVVDNRLVPAGTFAAAPPTWSGPYTLTLSNGTSSQTCTVNITEGECHTAVGTTTNPDTGTFSQARYMTEANISLPLGTTIKMRNGWYNAAIDYRLNPRASYTGTGRFTYRSEWIDVSIDANGNPYRQHGMKVSFFNVSTGSSGDVMIPFDFKYVYFKYDYAGISSDTYMLRYNSNGSGWGVNIDQCRFEGGPNTTPKWLTGAMVRGSTTNAANVTDCTFTNIKVGILLASGTANGGSSTGSQVTGGDFSNLWSDGIDIQLGVVDYVIEDNLIWDFNPAEGNHPDGIQHNGIGTSSVDQIGGTIRKNFIVNTSPTIQVQGIFYDDTTGTGRIIDVVTNNNLILISTGGNGIKFNGCNGPSSQRDTVVGAYQTGNTNDAWFVLGGDAPGVDASVTNSISNGFVTAGQTGTITTTPATILELTSTDYDACFAAYTEAGLVNRTAIKNALTPLAGGTAMNIDGTYNSALFPDGSWNDGSVF